MRKTSYEQPIMNVIRMMAEDVVRTSENSNNAVVGSGDAIFKDYTSENWN